MVAKYRNNSKRKMQVRSSSRTVNTTKVGSTRAIRKKADSTKIPRSSINTEATKKIPPIPSEPHNQTIANPYTEEDLTSLATAVPKTKTAQLSGTEKRKARKKAKRLRKIIIAFVFLVILALGAGFVYLYNSDEFKIENIEITGVSHLTQEEMLLLANVPEGETLLRVDTGAIAERLKMDAWIKDVDIERAFPNTLKLKIRERAITAIVEVPTSNNSGVSTSTSNSGTFVRNWAISADYIWLMPIPDQNSDVGKSINPQIYSDVAGIMHIVDVSPSISPEIGTLCVDESVVCAIKVVASMTTELREQVKYVKAADSSSTTLVLNNGVEIALGTSEDIRDKERISLELLEKYAGRITHINVRNIQSPTWRTL